MTPTLAIALTAVFTAVSCALLGAFLVLRKMTMVGDAISHAVLPGIAVAYWLSQSRASLWMFLGAAAVGVFATIIIEVLRKNLKVQSDASIGMTFTTLFALGVILITFWSDSVDLDQEFCMVRLRMSHLILGRLEHLTWGQLRYGLLGCSLLRFYSIFFLATKALKCRALMKIMLPYWALAWPLGTSA